MIRATTPKHSFIFSVNPEEQFSEILISYAQNGKIILEKSKHDLIFSAEIISDENSSEEIPVYTASYTLTQEETRLFDPRIRYVTFQLRAITRNGEALASDKKRLNLYDVLNDEVLT